MYLYFSIVFLKMILILPKVFLEQWRGISQCELYKDQQYNQKELIATTAYLALAHNKKSLFLPENPQGVCNYPSVEFGTAI